MPSLESSALTPAVVAGGAAVVALAAWAVRQKRAVDWERALERVSHGVVVIRVSSVLAFDMNDRGFSVATGFVVDRTLGIIMTNRHVITTGPVTADAVLFNNEEIELTPLYADPEHDFGFFSYNTADVKFMRLQQVPLAPSAARVGLEVRVVGNDAGEKISILSGTIARVDRAAPSYGPHTYNDNNTFYCSCASNTSGGSSGSPVINSAGQAVMLNAGTSTKSASSYYLPLDRPVRALRLLQKVLRAGGQPGRSTVSRGTLGTILVHRAFGELRRLGLRRETEAAVRSALRRETGMLVIDQVVPGCPAHGCLESGDVLLSLHGMSEAQATEAQAASGHAAAAPRGRRQWCTTFLAMEELLDDRPGQWVCVRVQRGGVDLSVPLRVADLHALSATAVLEVGGCTLHMLSYQQARNWNMPPGRVVVAFSGYMLSNACVPSRAVITELNAVATPDLDSFSRALLALPDGARVPLKYQLPYSQHQERVAVITVERTWFAAERYDLDDISGQWRCTKLPPPPPPPPPAPQTVSFAVAGPPEVRMITPSIVRVFFDIPYQIDGVAALQYAGAGLVVDAQVGLVLVDRNTVPIALGNTRIEFASTVEVAAVPVFLHPTHNVAIVKYNPADLAGTSVATARLSPVPLHVGDECMFVGLSKLDAALPVFQPCSVRETCVMEVGIASVPRFRAVNEEVVRFDLGLALEDTIGGVFVNGDGEVQAIWAAYCNCSMDEEYYEQFEGMQVDQLIPIVAACSAQAASAAARPAIASQPGSGAKEAVAGGVGGGGGGPFGNTPPTAHLSSGGAKTAAGGGGAGRAKPEGAAPVSAIPRPRPRKSTSPSLPPRADLGSPAFRSSDSKAGNPPTRLRMSPRAFPTATDAVSARCAPADASPGLYPTASPPTAATAPPAGAPSAAHESPLCCSHSVPALPGLYFLDAELRPLSLSLACGSTAGAGLGLSRKWADVLAQCELQKRQVLSILRVMPGAPTYNVLQEGDLLLAVNGTPVNTFAAVEAAVLREPRIQLTLLRDGAEMVIETATSEIRSEGTMHIAVWCGLLLQHAYRDVLERGFVPPVTRVYISFYLFGSPAHKYKLVPKHWVVELNGQSVSSLTAFLELARTLPHGANVRLKTCDLNGKIGMYTVKTDHNYWRGYEVFADQHYEHKWVLRMLNEPREE